MRTAPLYTPVAILLAGAMVSGAIVWSMHDVLNGVRDAYQEQLAAYQSQLATSQAAAANVPAEPPLPAVDSSTVSTTGEPFIGSADAPVVMAYWFDYQCPFCRRIEESVMPDLITNYVTPGLLKIVFKDYTFLGADSQTAALAARAVWEVAPDKFYAWHKAMFDHQDQENSGWGNQADVIALTQTIPGIDVTKVQTLMTSEASQYNQELQTDGYEGSTMGISGTPGAIIGKQLIVGAQPYAQFKAAIDTALANSKPGTDSSAATGATKAATPPSP